MILIWLSGEKDGGLDGGEDSVGGFGLQEMDLLIFPSPHRIPPDETCSAKKRNVIMSEGR